MSKRLYLKAIAAWGKNAQVIMAIEEFSELIQAPCEDVNRINKTNVNLYEEMADAEIMLEQLKIIYEKDIDLISGYKADKLKKLEALLLKSGVE